VVRKLLSMSRTTSMTVRKWNSVSAFSLSINPALIVTYNHVSNVLLQTQPWHFNCSEKLTLLEATQKVCEGLKLRQRVLTAVQRVGNRPRQDVRAQRRARRKRRITQLLRKLLLTMMLQLKLRLKKSSNRRLEAQELTETEKTELGPRKLK